MKYLMIIVLALILLTSCADPITPIADQMGRSRAGFFSGVWHGMIAPLSFIVSLFNHDVAVYETYNNGNWYVFGFLFGIGVFAIGSSSNTGRK